MRTVETPLGYSNLFKEEWEAVRTLADDRNIVIKKADKGSCVVISDRKNYITEAESQLKNELVYKKVSFRQDMLCDLLLSIYLPLTKKKFYIALDKKN